jgi:hypothetical protein
MNITTANLTELKDQLFCAAEVGDLENVKKILDLFPDLVNQQVLEKNITKFAARHGHRNLLRFLLPGEVPRGELLELIRLASQDGHLEAITFLVSKFAQTFDYLNLKDSNYRELEAIIPESCKNAIYFPIVWNKIKGILYVHKKGKINEVPIKKLIKFVIKK